MTPVVGAAGEVPRSAAGGALQQAGVDQTLPGRGDGALGRAGIPAQYPGSSNNGTARGYRVQAPKPNGYVGEVCRGHHSASTSSCRAGGAALEGPVHGGPGHGEQFGRSAKE